MRPSTFPFLAIAKRYGVDYGDVLIYADLGRSGPSRDGMKFVEVADRLDKQLRNPHRMDCKVDIANALSEFLAIQRGEIDWLTGERK